MLNPLATQDEVGAFKDALESLAANLNFHVNSALGKAHGIELVHGYIDSHGNDFRVYRDSFGNIISGTDPTKANMVRFIVGGVPYYSPCLQQDPGAQPPGTGAIIVTPETSDGPAPTALITDYVTTETQSALNANTLFLAHTLLRHDIAHGQMTINPSPVMSGLGSVVASARLRLNWGGNLYEIPVDKNIGGPAQVPNVKLVPSSFSGSTSSGNVVLNLTFIPTIVSGALPMTFSWEYWNSQISAWVVLTPGNPGPVIAVPENGNPTGRTMNTHQLSTSTGAIFFEQASSPGSGGSDFCKFRLTATNASGSTHFDSHGNELIFFVYLQDSGGGCWFCTQGNKTREVTPHEWTVIEDIDRVLVRNCARMVVWYNRDGKALVQRMLDGGVPQSWFEQFVESVMEQVNLNGLEQAANYYTSVVAEMTKAHWPECAHPGFKAGLRYLENLHPKEGDVGALVVR